MKTMAVPFVGKVLVSIFLDSKRPNHYKLIVYDSSGQIGPKIIEKNTLFSQEEIKDRKSVV